MTTTCNRQFDCLVITVSSKTATLSCAVRFANKTALTCGNAGTRVCLVASPKRQVFPTQNRRSDAVLSCLPFRGRGEPTLTALPTPNSGATR